MITALKRRNLKDHDLKLDGRPDKASPPEGEEKAKDEEKAKHNARPLKIC
jgi:hypothetical protein